MSSPTLAQALPATASSQNNIGRSGVFLLGSFLDIWVLLQNAANTITGVSDGTHVFTGDPNVPIVTDSTDGWRLAHYTSNQLAAGGTFVPTANFTSLSNFAAMLVCEVAGSSGFLNSNGQLQSTPGTGTNGITSGSIAIAGSVDALLIGLSANATGNGSTTVAGTTDAYTDGGEIWTALNTHFARLESFALSGVSTASADFTAGVNSRRMTYGSIWAGIMAATTKTRRTRSSIGTRTGTRQLAA